MKTEKWTVKSVWVDPVEWEVASRKAAAEGRSLSEVVRELIADYNERELSK